MDLINQVVVVVWNPFKTYRVESRTTADDVNHNKALEVSRF